MSTNRYSRNPSISCRRKGGNRIIFGLKGKEPSISNIRMGGLGSDVVCGKGFHDDLGTHIMFRDDISDNDSRTSLLLLLLLERKRVCRNSHRRRGRRRGRCRSSSGRVFLRRQLDGYDYRSDPLSIVADFDHLTTIQRHAENLWVRRWHHIRRNMSTKHCPSVQLTDFRETANDFDRNRTQVSRSPEL